MFSIEAKIYLKKILDSCYYIILSNNSRLYLYDENLSRIKKLNKITGEKNINISIKYGRPIFLIYEKSSNILFCCDFWRYLSEKFNLDYFGVEAITSDLINKTIGNGLIYKTQISVNPLHWFYSDMVKNYYNKIIYYE